jgi:hypothetical protein
VADGVDPAVNAVEPPRAGTPPPATLMDSCGFELSDGDHAVLARGHPGDPRIRV